MPNASRNHTSARIGRVGHLRSVDASRTVPETTSHAMEVMGMRLHWMEAGGGADKPPVVLLHGLSDCHLSWSRVGPMLADDRRVLMLDLPGHGGSDRPDASYTLDWHARTVARWLEQLHIERTDVVGHSFGGGVAQMLLVGCRDRIRRVVLVAPGGLGKKIGGLLRLASLPWIVEHLGQPFMELATLLASSDARRDGAERWADVAALSRFNAQAGSARALARSVRDVVDLTGQKRLFKHRMHEIERLPPMLVLWGDQDAITPIDHGFAFATALPGVNMTVFEGCGHFLHHERPEAAARLIRRFLDATLAD